MIDLAKRILKRFDCKSTFFDSLPGGAARILDLGCGKGNNGVAIRAIRPTIELHGVDILPEGDVPAFYAYKLVDLDKGVLPYPDDYFDAIIFTHVIEHLRSPLPIAKELKRIMKRNAMIYVETPNWTSLFVPSFGFHREQHNPFNFYDDHTHVKPWTKHGLFEFLFQACGLRVLKVGNTRNWLRVPIDCPVILFGLLAGKRSYVISSVWNLYGWCIYATGVKE